MRTIRGYRALLVFLFFAVAGCGGGVSGIGTRGGDGGPVNPGDDLGDDEIGPAQDGGPDDSRCATGDPIGTGLACRVTGLTCPLGTVSDCNGGMRTLECVCEGQSWSCDPVPPDPSCPPPSSCPDPSTVYPGTACGLAEGQLCASTEIPSFACDGEELPPPTMGICTCTTGGWQCPQSKVPCVSPPASCPDPSGVYAGGYCPSPGMSCSGNPQNCGGDTYYDALECQGDYWVTLARTTCDLYPYPDGDVYDAPFLGASVDSGAINDGN